MKTAVITGASSGIGRATATLLVERGYRVYDLSRTDKPQQGVIHLTCDITSRATIDAAIERIQQESGRIDLLILCAGMGVAGAIEFTSEEEMHRQFDINVYGSIRVVQAALPVMRQQEEGQYERGRIVFISSMAAQFGIPFQSMYSASKAAINSFAFCLRNEVKDYRIRVTCVMPGDVHTAFKRSTDLNGSDVYPHMKPAIEQMERDEANGLTSQAVARRVVKACTSRRTRLFYTSDFLSDVEHFIARLVSSSFAAHIVGKMYHC